VRLEKAIFFQSFCFAILFFFEASFSKASTIAPGFSPSTFVFCRNKLKMLSAGDIGASSHSSIHTDFVSIRRQALKKDPALTGEPAPEALQALGVGMAQNNKSFFVKKLWWQTKEVLIHPNLKGIGEAEAVAAKNDGIWIPEYRGDMFFKNNSNTAKMTVRITDKPKAVNPIHLDKVPELRQTASLDIVINDRDGNVSEKSFYEWVKALMTQSQAEGVVVDRKLSPTVNVARKPYYDIVVTKLADGSTNYALKVKNVVLPYFRLNWMIENAQRSLGTTDYRNTRLAMQDQLGIPAYADTRSFIENSPFLNSSQPMKHFNPISDDVWDAISEQPKPEAKPRSKPKAEPYKRNNRNNRDNRQNRSFDDDEY
jgi:hypothetical protein